MFEDIVNVATDLLPACVVAAVALQSNVEYEWMATVIKSIVLVVLLYDLAHTYFIKRQMYTQQKVTTAFVSAIINLIALIAATVALSAQSARTNRPPPVLVQCPETCNGFSSLDA